MTKNEPVPASEPETGPNAPITGTPAAFREHAALPRGALAAWWHQGLRTALFSRVDWSGLLATPAVLLVLLLLPYLFGVMLQRLYIPGEARFYWPALMVGWWAPLAALWACWLAMSSSSTTAASPGRAPDTVSLFGLLVAQRLIYVALSAVVLVPIGRNTDFVAEDPGRTLYWVVWVLSLCWFTSAQMAALWRGGSARPAQRMAAMAVLVASVLLQHTLQPLAHWYPLQTGEEQAATDEFRLTQELMERQPRLLGEQLQALAPREAGAVNVYAITFAPYASEDVFKRESELVDGVMQQRFGAAGRSLVLLNHRDTAEQRPWATPLNLQRAIQRAAGLMSQPDDLLFIHLTSHGARDGELAAELWPLAVDAVTPQALRAWLDEAGVRNRVISISACYSGSWIEPLADDHTLVMTAADATHTSYGCGARSELTFFGRAMYDEELRRTWSFEKAHAAARITIDEREREAGKTDGYSNPQIRVGEGVRETLRRLEAQQAARAR